MAAPRTADELLKMLANSELVPPAAVDRFLAEYLGPAEPIATAEALIDAGLITPFQANYLLQGRWKGFRFGPYVLLAEQAVGETTATYLAEHSSMRRRVALKVLSPEQAKNPGALERFCREGQAAAALDHPNLVRAFDLHQEAGFTFIVMEQVTGFTLAQALRDHGRIPYPRAVHFILQAAAGLQHAHERGVLHGNINPANLIVDSRDCVKIVDMGLASFAADAEAEGGGPLGAADYLAPEQALRSPDVDPRADLYSLGATLYALIAGAPPFGGGATTQKLLLHQLAEPASLRDFDPEVPRGLAAFVGRLLAKDPAARPPTAAHVIAALARWADPPFAPAFVAAAAAVAAEFDGAGSLPPPPDEDDADDSGLEEGPLPPKPKLGLGILGMQVNEYVAAAALLGAAVLVLAVLLIYSTGSPAPAASATRPGASGLAGPEQLQEVRLDAVPHDVRFFDGGKKLACCCLDGSVRQIDAATGRELKKNVFAAEAIRSLAITDDGTGMLLSYESGKVSWLDLNRAALRSALPPHRGCAHGLALSADGTRAFVAGGDGWLRAYALNGDTAESLWEKQLGRNLWTVAPAPGLKTVAVAGGPFTSSQRTNDDFAITVHDAATGEERRAFDGHEADVRRLAFSPDGSRLASAGFDGTLRLWDIAQGKALKTIEVKKGAFVEGVAFLPDGRRVLTGVNRDGLVQLWDVDTGRALKSLVGHRGKVTAVCVAADGRRAASVGDDRTLRLWDLTK